MMKRTLEHEWLNTIVSAASDAIIVIDRRRMIRFANAAAAALAGAGTPAELIGHSYDHILCESQVYNEDGTPVRPSDLPSAIALARGVATQGKLFERMHRGKHAWFRIDAIPIKGIADGSDHCIVRIRDVSNDKWARDRLDFLLRSEQILSLNTDFRARLVEKTRLTIPHLADWCTLNIVNREGGLDRVVVAHRDPSKEGLVQRLAELSEEELGDDGGVRGAVKAGVPYFVPEVSSAELATQVRVSPERRALIERLQVCSSMTLPIISSGSVVGALSVAYAESGRHYTKRDLQFMSEFCCHLGLTVDIMRLYEEIKARDRAKDDFFAALSHELRNPLAPIKSSLELLMLSENLREHREELELVQGQFAHLTSILNDLLDVTRYMRGKMQLEKSEFDLSKMLREVVSSYTPLIDARRITLHADIPAAPILAHGDPVRLKQAVMNLLDNAQKFTPAQGTIRISLRQERAWAAISIRDTGVGIPKGDLEHVFELHFQGSNRMRQYHSGLGLGLVLVKNIAELHQGRVEVSSEGEGAGSEFRLMLPLHVPTGSRGREALSKIL